MKVVDADHEFTVVHEVILGASATIIFIRSEYISMISDI